MGDSYGCIEYLWCVIPSACKVVYITFDIRSLCERLLQFCRVPAVCCAESMQCVVHDNICHQIVGDSYGCVECLKCVVQSACNVLHLTSYFFQGDSYGCAECMKHQTSLQETPTAVQNACNVSQYLTSHLLMGDFYSCADWVPAKCHNIWHKTSLWACPTVVQSAYGVSQHPTSDLFIGESYACAECLICVTTSDIRPLCGRLLQLCRVPAKCHNIWHQTSL